MKRLSITLPDELYDKLWKIHAETRDSLNSIINRILEEGLNENKKM
jgi:metal-responsive CopG/Arc/MetJ family transcriptional regulator